MSNNFHLRVRKAIIRAQWIILVEIQENSMITEDQTVMTVLGWFHRKVKTLENGRDICAIF